MAADAARSGGDDMDERVGRRTVVSRFLMGASPRETATPWSPAGVKSQELPRASSKALGREEDDVKTCLSISTHFWHC